MNNGNAERIVEFQIFVQASRGFFGFNRPDCTRKTFAAIRAFQPDRLLLVADGPRAGVAADAERCPAVREILRQVDWPCEVRQNYSEVNLGCKKRMSSGLDWVFSQLKKQSFSRTTVFPARIFLFFVPRCSRVTDRKIRSCILAATISECRKRGEAGYYFSRYVHVWGCLAPGLAML